MVYMFLFMTMFDCFFCRVCKPRNWNSSRPATGKVVLCFYGAGAKISEEAAAAVKAADGSGLIFVVPVTLDVAYVDIIPIVLVDFDQGTKIKNYLDQSRNLPLVRIKPPKTVTGKSPAPTVADFSSRGPSSTAPDFLKVWFFFFFFFKVC
jgi:hypothetical protein